MPQEVINYHGEEYTIEYNELIKCTDCENEFTLFSPTEEITCDFCGEQIESKEVLGLIYEDITRYNLLNHEGIDSGEEVIFLLRNRANKYEAMINNGWELASVGGQSSVWFTKGDIDYNVIE